MKLSTAIVFATAGVAAASRHPRDLAAPPGPPAPQHSPEWWEQDFKCGEDVQHLCWDKEHSADDFQKCLHDNKDKLSADCKDLVEEQMAFECALYAAAICGPPEKDFSKWKECVEKNKDKLEKHCPDKKVDDPAMHDDFKCGIEVYEECHGLPEVVVHECFEHMEHQSDECYDLLLNQELFDCGITLQGLCWDHMDNKEDLRKCVHEHDKQFDLVCPHRHHH